MGRSLVIVESPTKARTINRFLGKDFEVKSCMGHIRDLPENELGVDVHRGFRPKYHILPDKRNIVKELRALGKRAETVYLATDPDREGEAIAWHVAQVMELPEEKARRITFHEITRRAVTEALAHPQRIDMHKVDAQQARRILDRLVGYQVSPLLWKTVRRGLSAGRVQSVALRLVCEREEEIAAFVPKEYWTIGVFLDNGQIAFEADLWKIEGKKAKVSDEAQAKALVEELWAQEFTIEKIETKRQKRRPAPPFITSTLQQEASRLLKMSPQQTMRVAQQLYEGVEVDGDMVGLITYMRTDSTRVADEAVAAAREYIVKTYGPKYRPQRPNIYRSRAGAQEAHEAIRPTSLERPPEAVKRALTPEQFRLYRLIWNRFVASQMAPQEVDITTVTVAGGRFALQTKASVEAFDGFTRIYSEGRDEEQTEQEHPIPRELLEAWQRQQEGADDARLKGYLARGATAEQRFTTPPPRYTEATLIKELEARGIGRPSTYAQIISTIFERNYVEKQQGRLVPTELGKVVNRILVHQFPDLFNVEFTAKMEDDLDRVERGNDRWDAVVKDFYEDFARTLHQAMEHREELRNLAVEPTDERCEKCGRPMVIRFGRHGKFLACSGFPECKNAKPLPSEQTEPTPAPDGIRCPECGGPMMLRNGRFGEFYACARYPECKGTRPIPTGVACPRPGCGGQLVVKFSRRGKRFYGCDRYPECDVVYWDRPVPLEEPDPETGLHFRLEKIGKDGKTRLVPAKYPPQRGYRRARRSTGRGGTNASE